MIDFECSSEKLPDAAGNYFQPMAKSPRDPLWLLLVPFPPPPLLLPGSDKLVSCYVLELERVRVLARKTD
jgi:hypothetical protein